ncbi:MAG: hypothetical protein M3N91_16030 [Pseudomonadota bacterium]|nr:hypothetical protein [Pseudomonadota bacterium]
MPKRIDPKLVPTIVGTQMALFRAGHAHAGVWLLLSLILQILLDAAKLPTSTKWCIGSLRNIAPAAQNASGAV